MHKVRGQRANVQLPPSPQRPIPNCPEWLTYRNQLPHRECEAGCIYKQEIGTLEEITSGGVCWITLRHQWGNCPKPEGLSFDPLVK